jgi:ribosomal protein S18 acetylase RimI-like enzyme
MRLFRRPHDLSTAQVRRADDADITAIARLLRDGGRRYYALNGEELSALLQAGHAVVLEGNGELLGVALIGRIIGGSCWLRGFALEDGVSPRDALPRMLPTLEHLARALGALAIYVAGDETADLWLTPLLQAHGFRVSTEVVVYEKREMSFPSGGNEDVTVRPAEAADLVAVLEVDQRCFEAQWTKDDAILGQAILYGPFCVVAEHNGEIVGYAYATSHFSGRLVHLVRIAVLPERQGAAIGVRLLAELITYADTVGAYNVTLNTQAYNTSAQRLYRWFGFYPTGEQQSILVRVLADDDRREQLCQQK